MEVHLLDGTYELFRHHFGVPSHLNSAGIEVAATRGVVRSVLSMLADGVTHIGVATDHVVESFRNDLWPGYKTSEGMDPVLLAQFPILEDALRAAGVEVWAMTDWEADDALASAAKFASAQKEVERVIVCTPDKDLAQSVEGKRVVQFDRRRLQMRDEAGVVERFGVSPRLIPDYLALVGDSADGFPGIRGFGAKTAATILAKFGHLEDIPPPPWNIGLRNSATLAGALRDNHDLLMLFRDLATLRTHPSVVESLEQLRWTGPKPELGRIAALLDDPNLVRRAEALAAGRS